MNPAPPPLKKKSEIVSIAQIQEQGTALVKRAGEDRPLDRPVFVTIPFNVFCLLVYAFIVF